MSVVLPTRDRAELLPRSMDSVLRQDYDDLELIVVDDGSSDGTESVVRRIAARDSRVEYVRLKKGRGAPAARNAGAALARGELLAFQDSDDEWLAGKLGRQVTTMEGATREVALVYCGFIRLEGDRTWRRSETFAAREALLDRLVRTNFISTPAALVRRGPFQEVGGFDESLPRLQDWDLWLRLARRWEFRGIAEPLLVQHHQPDSISADPTAFRTALGKILERHEDLFLRDRENLAVMYRDLAHYELLNRRSARGRRFLWRSLRLAPSPGRALALTLALIHPGIYGKASSRLRPVSSDSPFEREWGG